MIFLLLVFTTFIAHFVFFPWFGFYEDDYGVITPALDRDLMGLPELIAEGLEDGRPLSLFLPQLFSFIGINLGGLWLVYVIALLIVSLNAFLFFSLLKQIGPEILALMGALSFSLFPADTTRPFLTHAFVSQISLMFLIAAALCYLSGKRKPSYLIILGTLFTYEIAFPVFFAVPLLKKKWDHKLLKELIVHTVILSVIFLSMFVFRAFMGDPHLDMTPGEWYVLPLKMLASMGIGPVTVAFSFVNGPFQTLANINLTIVIASIVSLAIFTWTFYRLNVIDMPEEEIAASPSWLLKLFDKLQIPRRHWGTARLAMAAIILILFAFPFSFAYFPPIKRYGRETVAHYVAAFGTSILVACFCTSVLSLVKHRWKRLAVFSIACYFSLLVGYGVLIQQDYRKSWIYQRVFWTDVVQHCPDLTDGTLIFVKREGLVNTKYIYTFSWANAIILTQLYQFPSNWSAPPRLFVCYSNWTEQVTFDGNNFEWMVPAANWPEHWERLPESNVIVLEVINGKLVRNSGPIKIQGQTFQLKLEENTANPQFEKEPLYNYLIDEAKVDRDRGVYR
jgi:hypothetical protein